MDAGPIEAAMDCPLIHRDAEVRCIFGGQVDPKSWGVGVFLRSDGGDEDS
jgi:hypothetical protein